MNSSPPDPSLWPVHRCSGAGLHIKVEVHRRIFRGFKEHRCGRFRQVTSERFSSARGILPWHHSAGLCRAHRSLRASGAATGSRRGATSDPCGHVEGRNHSSRLGCFWGVPWKGAFSLAKSDVVSSRRAPYISLFGGFFNITFFAQT